MSQINPFIGSILQTPQVQRQQAADKDRQVRRAAEQSKNTALTDDQLEHQVESSEELSAIHEDQKHDRQQFKRPRPHKPKTAPGKDENDSHLDLTA